MSTLITWSVLLVAIWLQASRPCVSTLVKQYAIALEAGATETLLKVYETDTLTRPIKPDDVKLLELPSEAAVSTAKPAPAKKPFNFWEYIKNGFLSLFGQKSRDESQLDAAAPADRSRFAPGLRAFADEPDKVGAYLGKIMAVAKEVVKSDRRPSSPVFVFFSPDSLLLLTDKQKADLMKKVHETLANTSPFKHSPENVREISSEQEAIYDLVAKNFLKGTLTTSGAATYGVLDMDAVSTENAFVAGDDVTAAKSYEIAGKIFKIYAKSYRGYGAALAQDKFYEYLLQRANGDTTITSPCHNSDFDEKGTIGETEYDFKGSYHEAKCRIYIKNALFCSSCPFTTATKPQLKGQFYGYGIFHHAFKATGLATSSDKPIGLMDIKEAAKTTCGKTIAGMVAEDPQASARCFQLSYIMELLKRGYDVEDDTFKLYVDAESDAHEIDGSLGVILLHYKKLLEG